VIVLGNVGTILLALGGFVAWFSVVPYYFASGIVLDQVGLRLKHSRCPQCGSDNLEIVWRREDPKVVSYTCLDCKAVTKESPQ